MSPALRACHRRDGNTPGCRRSAVANRSLVPDPLDRNEGLGIASAHQQGNGRRLVELRQEAVELLDRADLFERLVGALGQDEQFHDSIKHCVGSTGGTTIDEVQYDYHGTGLVADDMESSGQTDGRGKERSDMTSNPRPPTCDIRVVTGYPTATIKLPAVRDERRPTPPCPPRRWPPPSRCIR